MKQSTMSKNNFVIWKFCAKDMNNFQQAFSRIKEVWRELMLWTYFWSLILQRKSCLELGKHRESNIIPPPKDSKNPKQKMQLEVVVSKYTNKYIQEDSWGFISPIYISHMDFEHPMGRIYILVHTKTIMCNANTLYMLIGYMWTNGSYEKVIKSVFPI